MELFVSARLKWITTQQSMFLRWVQNSA